MNKIIKDACILFAITLIAGVLLGCVYEVTKNPIANQNEKAKQNAYKAVMADADSFEAIQGQNFTDGPTTITSNSQDFSADEIVEAVAGVKNNKIVGYVITIVAGDGYGGDIKFSVGIKADGTYAGTSISVIQCFSREAPFGCSIFTSTILGCCIAGIEEVTNRIIYPSYISASSGEVTSTTFFMGSGIFLYIIASSVSGRYSNI